MCNQIRLAVLGCVLLSFVAVEVSAEQYKTITVVGKNKAGKKVRLDARNIKKQISQLRDPINKMKFGTATLNDAAKKKIQLYYHRNFAYITQEDGHGDAAKLRLGMLNEIRKLKKQSDHDYLMTQMYTFCSKLIPHSDEGNYHPVVRFNCMALMAGLNRKELVTGANAVPEVPLSQARTFMLKQLDDPNQIDVVRLAALRGLLRHAELSRIKSSSRAIPAGDQAKLFAYCSKTISEAAPEGRDAGAHVWFQRLCADILGAMGQPGADGAIAKLLDQTIQNKERDLSLRCSCSNALGRIKYAQPPIKADTAAGGMGWVAVASIRNEVDRIDKILAAKAAGGGVYGGGPVGGGYGEGPSGGYGDEGGGGYDNTGGGYGEGPGGPGNPYGAPGANGQPLEPPEDPIITGVRRQLKHQLNCVTVGLVGETPKKVAGGMLSIAQGQEAAAVKNIDKNVREVLSELDKKNLRPDRLKAELATLADKIERASARLLASR